MIARITLVLLGLGIAGYCGYLGMSSALRDLGPQRTDSEPTRVETPVATPGENAVAATSTRHGSPATRPAPSVLPESEGYDVLIKLIGPFEKLEEHEPKTNGDSK